MKNKYIIRSRISEAKFREILRLFCADLTSTSVSELTGISRVTTNKIFNSIRLRILDHQEGINNSLKFTGDVELDESYCRGEALVWETQTSTSHFWC